MSDGAPRIYCPRCARRRARAVPRPAWRRQCPECVDHRILAHPTLYTHAEVEAASRRMFHRAVTRARWHRCDAGAGGPKAGGP